MTLQVRQESQHQLTTALSSASLYMFPPEPLDDESTNYVSRLNSSQEVAPPLASLQLWLKSTVGGPFYSLKRAFCSTTLRCLRCKSSFGWPGNDRCFWGLVQKSGTVLGAMCCVHQGTSSQDIAVFPTTPRIAKFTLELNLLGTLNLGYCTKETLEYIIKIDTNRLYQVVKVQRAQGHRRNQDPFPTPRAATCSLWLHWHQDGHQRIANLSKAQQQNYGNANKPITKFQWFEKLN